MQIQAFSPRHILGRDSFIYRPHTTTAVIGGIDMQVSMVGLEKNANLMAARGLHVARRSEISIVKVTSFVHEAGVKHSHVKR